MPMVMLLKISPECEFCLVDVFNNLLKHEGCNCVLGPVEGSFRDILSVDDVPRRKTAPRNFQEREGAWALPGPNLIYIGDYVYWSAARVVAEGEFDRWQKLYELTHDSNVHDLWTRVSYEYALQQVIANQKRYADHARLRLDQALTDVRIATKFADRAQLTLEECQQMMARLGQLSEAESRRVSRENHLRDLGFEEPSEEQRRNQLAQNVAMLDWPKT